MPGTITNSIRVKQAGIHTSSPQLQPFFASHNSTLFLAMLLIPVCIRGAKPVEKFENPQDAKSKLKALFDDFVFSKVLHRHSTQLGDSFKLLSRDAFPLKGWTAVQLKQI